MSNIEKLINKFYTLSNNRYEWQYLKTLLDEINSCIVESSSFTYSHYLSLSKLLIFCLSPTVSLVHRQVFISLENLYIKPENSKIQSFLSFSTFYHCRKVEKVDIEAFSQVLSTYLKVNKDDKVLILGLLCAMLSNPEGLKHFYLKIIEEVLIIYPIMARECFWVACTKQMADSREIFKEVRSLEMFDLENSIILNAFLTGLSSLDLHVKCAAIDAIYEIFSLKNRKNHRIKIFVFANLVEQTQHSRVLMRLAKFLPEDNEEYASKVMASALKVILKKTKKIDLLFIENILELNKEHHFLSQSFYEKIMEDLIKNIGKFCKNDIEFFNYFKNIFEFDQYETFYSSLLNTFPKAIRRKDLDDYFEGINVVKDMLGLPKVLMVQLLNQLIENVENFKLSTVFFKTCENLLNDVFPENLGNFFQFFQENLEKFSIGELKSFGEFYLKVLKINPKLKVNKISLNNARISDKMLDCLMILSQNLKIPLEYDVFQMLWDNYFSEFHEKVKLVLLYYALYAEDWIKFAVKMLKSKKGFLLLINFLNFCFVFHVQDLRNSNFIQKLSLKIHEKVEYDYSLEPYLGSLKELLFSDLVIFYEHHFDSLLDHLSAGLSKKSVILVEKTVNILIFSISPKTCLMMRSGLLSQPIKTKSKTISKGKNSVLNYFDLLLCISFQYLALYKSFKNTALTVFYLLQSSARHTDLSSATKLLDFAHESLNSSDFPKSSKVLIIKVLICIDFSKICMKERKNFENFLKNSKLSSLYHFAREELEKNAENCKKTIKILRSMTEFYRGIYSFYINFKLPDLAPMYYVKLLLAGIIQYPDVNTAFYMVEFLKSLEDNIQNDWVINWFILDNPNLIDVLIASEKSHASFLHVLLEVAVLLSKNTSTAEGLIQLWSNLYNTKSKPEEIDGLLKYLPFFQITLDKIIAGTSNHLKRINPPKLHSLYLNFLCKFCTIYQSELEIVSSSIPQIETILQQTNLSFTFFQITDSLYKIFRSESLNTLNFQKLSQTVKPFYLKFFSELFQKNLSSSFQQITENNEQILIISQWMQDYGGNFLSFLVPNEKDRFSLLKSWLQMLLKSSVSSKVTCVPLFLIFNKLSKNQVLYTQYFRESLLGLVKNNEFLLEVFEKNPSVCFSWCEVLNQCSGHSKLFTDFRANFEIKKKTATYSQEIARLCFVTSLLLYTGDVEDYISPFVLETIKSNIQEIIKIDNFAPIAILNLMVLSVRLSSDTFFEILQIFWPGLLVKYLEMQVFPDTQLLCSLLFLLEILVFLDFPLLTQIPFFNKPGSFTTEPRKTSRLILHLSSSFSLTELKQAEKALISSFNTFSYSPSEFNPADLASRIESEFIRVKSLA
jgi:hypothetical protein